MLVNNSVCFTDKEGQVMFVMPKFTIHDKFNEVENELSPILKEDKNVVVVNLK